METRDRFFLNEFNYHRHGIFFLVEMSSLSLSDLLSSWPAFCINALGSWLVSFSLNFLKAFALPQNFSTLLSTFLQLFYFVAFQPWNCFIRQNKLQRSKKRGKLISCDRSSNQQPKQKALSFFAINSFQSCAGKSCAIINQFDLNLALCSKHAMMTYSS